jgi:hypothetical protein
LGARGGGDSCGGKRKLPSCHANSHEVSVNEATPPKEARQNGARRLPSPDQRERLRERVTPGAPHGTLRPRP